MRVHPVTVGQTDAGVEAVDVFPDDVIEEVPFFFDITEPPASHGRHGDEENSEKEEREDMPHVGSLLG